MALFIKINIEYISKLQNKSCAPIFIFDGNLKYWEKKLNKILIILKYSHFILKAFVFVIVFLNPNAHMFH